MDTIQQNFSKLVSEVSEHTLSTPSDFVNSHPVLRIIFTLIVFGFITQQIKGFYDAQTSILRKIPGPWYAPLTSLHLTYLFANGSIWKYVKRQHAKYGPVMRLGPRQIWVSDKEGLKDILLTTDLPKITMYAEISRDRESPGLFGEIRPKPHNKLKRFLGPAFTVSAVDQLDSFFMDCVSVLLQNYYKELEKPKNKGGFITDLMRDLHCLALDIMGESNFGRGFGQLDGIFDPKRIKTEEDKEWAKIPDAIFDGQTKRYGLVYVKRTLRSLGIPIRFDWPSKMVKAISSLIDERRSEDEEKAKERRQDVLKHMLDEGNRPDTGTRMTNQDIIDQMSELLLAGSETTSGSIGCIFLEIARNPKVKEKLIKSLPVLGKDDRILDSKSVREEDTFHYLEAVIKEGLRMHPIASEMGRRTKEEAYEVGGYEIPPFTVVSASYRDLHRNNEFWPEADKFWPERWLEGDARDGAPEPDMDAYYPFSAGKHSCIGKNFAYAEIRTVLANIFSRFDIEEVDKDKVIDFRQYITMQFVDGSWKCKMIPREQQAKN